MDLLSLTEETHQSPDDHNAANGARNVQQLQSPRLEAAKLLSFRLSSGKALTRKTLRETMTAAYGGADADGAWSWKDAYDAAEVAEVRHLLRAGPALIGADPSTVIARLETVTNLQPPNRLRTEESLSLQQFSTPAPYAYAAMLAADIRPGDIALEPSAGHGGLAAFARISGAAVILNEFDTDRADALESLFGLKIHTENAAQIDDLLADPTRPSIVLMNPPFAKSVTRGDYHGEAGDHIWSAFKRLAPGGRLVSIVGHGLTPNAPNHARFWRRIYNGGQVRLAAGVEPHVYARKGASVSTRLLVIDKFLSSNDVRGGCDETAICETGDLEGLVAKIATIAPRIVIPESDHGGDRAPRRIDRQPPKTTRPRQIPSMPIISTVRHRGEEIAYEFIDADAASQAPTTPDDEGIYQTYGVQRIRIADAKNHPTPLTQSTALASVAPPAPQYKPHLPKCLITDEVLSDAQLESVIYAGEAHDRFIEGYFVRNSETGQVSEARETDASAFQLRLGYFIGDGTGCGKGRQLAGIIMDNWIKGRRKAVWISKSDKLHEDCIRDWTALGGAASEVIPQSRYKLGKRIAAFEGILFTTFATLRGGARNGKPSRLDQLLEWLGEDYEGVIGFDEAHAMQKPAASKSDRGLKAASQQGRAGVDLQMRAPSARVVYASATGASAVENLAYAERLGLWRGPSAPFKSREEFITEMNKGGIAAMEMVCRDLKAMGLYCARNLSFEGVEYEFLDHELTAEQIEIYDAYADAFKIIHNNLEDALEAIEVVDEEGTRNRYAVAAARSAFESTKQRFFNHLLTAMKVPTLIEAIRRDIADGHATVIQIVSTGEAVMDRMFAQLSAQDLRDGNFDLTPRDAVMDYLWNSFPTQLHRIVEKDDGEKIAEPVFDDAGNPVQSREALEMRSAVIEHLGALPPVTSALDQLIWTLGPENIAEITGRRRRVIRKTELGGERVEIESRPASVNIAETNAFMDDRKQALIFSEAGGTGRSYHSDRGRKNQRRRRHYLLEGGWNIFAAVQGLGRTHRTHQRWAPHFLPVRSNVNGEKRFLSTIARRLNALGALTKGERQTGGQGLFRAEDNLESTEAREALLIFFKRLALEPQGGVSLNDFIDMTGLKLLDQDGTLKENLPPISRFLNRMLALRISVQNTLFGVFEEIIDNRVEAARAAGTLDVGAETITADSLKILDTHVLRVDPASKSETKLLRIARRTKSHPRTFDDIVGAYGDDERCFYVNDKSKRAAYVMATTALTDEDTGAVHDRVILMRPNDHQRTLTEEFDESAWSPAAREAFARTWAEEVVSTPEFSEDEFGLVTGLIMPLWSLLAEKRPIVYRVTDDDGVIHLGRHIAPARIGALLSACGVEGAAARVTPSDVMAAIKRSERVNLQSDAFIAGVRVMDKPRIEIRDYEPSWLEALKACGCFTEIIQWRTRVFIPNDDQREIIIARVLARVGPSAGVAAAA